jgi:group I intron endonuclease
MAKRETISGIYKITNKLNDKVYIGSSQNIYQRWEEHTTNIKYRNPDSVIPFKDIREISDLKFEIVEKVNYLDSINILLEKEKNYIQLFDSCNKERGYNRRLNSIYIKPTKKSKNTKVLITMSKEMKSELETIAEKE